LNTNQDLSAAVESISEFYEIMGLGGFERRRAVASALYLGGLPIPMIAQEVGVTQDTVRSYLRVVIDGQVIARRRRESAVEERGWWSGWASARSRFQRQEEAA
jgi:hypothetical protein